MDVAILEKVRRFLIPFVSLVLLLALAGLARAQSGACPPNSYTLGDPGGFWPDDTTACTYNQLLVSVDISGGNYPCSQYVSVEDGHLLISERDDIGYGTTAVIVPDSSQYYGDMIRMSFLIFGRNTLPLIDLVPPGAQMDHANILIEYYTISNTVYSYIETPLTNHTIVDTWYDDGLGINHYYRVYLVDQSLPTSEGSGGYIRVRLYWNDDPVFPVRRNYGIASWRFGAFADTFPAHCEIPNGDLPSTPVPATPTGTLPPTWTPDPTPSATPIITPGQTAPAITPQPTVTVTPITFPTVQAENTPTPWPPYSIAPLSISAITWPTVDAVTVVPAAAATLTNTGSTLDNIQATIDSEWSDNQAFFGSAMDTSITTTTGISAPVEIANVITSTLGMPVSYAKSVTGIMPNTAPYISVLFALAGWIVFNLIAKVGLQVIMFVFELLRRLWELIPFIG